MTESSAASSSDVPSEITPIMTAEDHIRAAIVDLRQRTIDARNDLFQITNSPLPEGEGRTISDIMSQTRNPMWQGGMSASAISRLEQALLFLESSPPQGQ